VFAKSDQRILHVCLQLATIVNLGRVEIADNISQRLLVELVHVPGNKRRIQQHHNPVACEQEQYRGYDFDHQLRNDELVQLVTAGTRVYVVAFKVGQSDYEVDGYEQRYDVEDYRAQEDQNVGHGLYLKRSGTVKVLISFGKSLLNLNQQPTHSFIQKLVQAGLC
jgi:hypothetical protein